MTLTESNLHQIPNDFVGALLKGKNVMITGAGSRTGCGRAMAHLLAAHGARLAITDRDGSSALAVADEIGSEHVGLPCDITDPDQCALAWRQASERIGPVDVLVNNAGITARRPTLEIEDSEFDQMLQVNAYGTFNMTQAALSSMVERGSGNIIYISSMAAQRGGGTYGASHYVAAKAAMAAFTIAIAREFGPKGIRANVVAPNLIDNDMSVGMTREQRSALEQQVPLRRSGLPMEVAGAVLFMASGLSAYCNGATLDVNGGFNTR